MSEAEIQRVLQPLKPKTREWIRSTVLGFVAVIVSGGYPFSSQGNPSIQETLARSAQIAGPSDAPGLPYQWESAAKQAIGTSYEESSAASPVWFTVANGALSEVFFPNPDQAQIGELQFIVTDGKRVVSRQKRDTLSEVRFLGDGMTVEITGEDRGGLYSFIQQIVTDPASPVVRVRTRFRWNRSDLRLFVSLKPTLQGSSAMNRGEVSKEALFASSTKDGEKTHLALAASAPWSAASVGYWGFSDAEHDLSRNFRLTRAWKEAGPGHLSLTGEIATPGTPEFEIELALAFGPSRSAALTFAKTSLAVPFSALLEQYEAGWKEYLQSTRDAIKNIRFMEQSLFARRSLITLKMHESKVSRGILASALAHPERALVSEARAQYRSALALSAAGDRRTATAIWKRFLEKQLPDGSWNSPDATAYAVLLARQLNSTGSLTLSPAELHAIRRAATAIVSAGPRTDGLVLESVAVRIAALKAATALTGDSAAEQVAEQWASRLESWSFVKRGSLGQNYYIHSSASGEPLELENVPETPDSFALETFDGRFMDLVRLGIRNARDPRIQSSLAIYDHPELGVSIRSGSGRWYRKAERTGYGPFTEILIQPVMSGERGHLALLAGDLETARSQLYALEKSALPTGLLPDAVSSDGLSIPLGVACPSISAHAEDILLHRSLEEGSVFDAIDDSRLQR